MKEQVRVGFVGAGGNARGHMRQVKALEGAVVAAVCDVDEARAHEAAALFSCPAYTSVQAMLEAEELDAVYISIPVFAHGEPERAVIERGLPFFVEKPVALDLETAQSIAEAVARKGILTCVGYQLRYCGSADAARRILAESPAGMAVGRYWCGTGRGDPSNWRRRWALSGGQLVEQATHTLDLMRYFVGEVVEVYALQANRFLPQTDCPDMNVVALQFKNGALGSLTATWAYDPSDWSQANVIDLLLDGEWLHWTASALVRRRGKEEERIEEAGQNIDAVFIEAVRTGDASLIRSPYADGVRSLAVSLAANESARLHRPVEVRL